jgi:hypothetical protein
MEMSETKFQHRVNEQAQTVKRSDWYSIDDLNGYTVLLVQDEDLTELSIAPKDWGGLRLGILRCHPKSVADIEKFAEDAPALFRAIADELRALGKDDLRSKWDVMKDEMDAERERIIASRNTVDARLTPEAAGAPQKGSN